MRRVADRSGLLIKPTLIQAGTMAEKIANSMIEASGLTKYYGSFVAIENVTFSIPAGQIVSFLGPNGAGKSTTMKILTGVVAPSAGTGSIAGKNIETDRIAASQKLGYLPEDGPLYLDMTPLALLKFFGEAREIAPNRLSSRIDAVIDQCALQQVLEKPSAGLSGAGVAA
jgi:ABC-2 type transport system ATP-binding protein